VAVYAKSAILMLHPC